MNEGGKRIEWTEVLKERGLAEKHERHWRERKKKN